MTRDPSCVCAIGRIEPRVLTPRRLSSCHCRRAASRGDDSAKSYLGYCHEHGYGVETDQYEAVRWYHEATHQGNNWAVRSLKFLVCQLDLANGANELAAAGLCRAVGAGVPKDEASAAVLFERASALGDKMGHYHFGQILVERGCPDKAAPLFTTAAGEGVPEAEYALALLLAQGIGGVAKDGDEAARLCSRAARKGYHPAMEALLYWAPKLHKSCPGQLRRRVQLVLMVGVRLSDRAGFVQTHGVEPSLPHLPVELWLCICRALRPIDFPAV